MPNNKNNSSMAFTIVELLIVIVIIGILAATTIVSYIGITAKANQTTIISDLANAKKQFELYKADHGVYPTGLENGTNCLTGATSPSPDTRYCLKSSGGSAYVLEDATGVDYTLKLTKGSLAYKITKDLAPTSTTAVVAAASFVKTWGGVVADYGTGIIQISDGGYVITGYTASFGAGSNDMFIAKYNASGILSWNKLWGGTGTDVGAGLVQTSDGGYIVTGYTDSFGTGSSDMFLAKYDTSGNLSWNRLWGGAGASSDIGQSVARTSDGGCIITGYTTSFGAGSNDMFIAKYDTGGVLSWSKIWGGTGSEVGRGVIQTDDGGYAVTGYVSSFGAGSSDMFLAKYDASGNLSWNKLWGGASNDYGLGIIQSSDNGYVVMGYTTSFGAGSNDMLLVKYDASGNLSWNKLWGGTGSDVGLGLVKASDNGYAIVGYTASFGAGTNDIFLAKYDVNGNLSWNKTYGGVVGDIGNGLVQGVDSGYAIVGYTGSYGAGSDDSLIAKFDSSGSIDNCSSPICQTPTATITTPSATITTPAATITTPSVTITTPTATVSSPTATVTTVVAP